MKEQQKYLFYSGKQEEVLTNSKGKRPVNDQMCPTDRVGP